MLNPESPLPEHLQGLSFEELANLADAWADLGDKHNWTEDTRREAREMARKLREQAARMRAIMLLRAAREAFDSPPRESP
ncbi:hypothetical protein DYH09_15405 [bacterium CPR1]|nr:hypothetical protein [bacterium CPR1]